MRPTHTQDKGQIRGAPTSETGSPSSPRDFWGACGKRGQALFQGDPGGLGFGGEEGDREGGAAGSGEKGEWTVTSL